MGRFRRTHGIIAALSGMAVSTVGHADWSTAPVEHRGGVMVGTQVGGGFALASGYPSSVDALGNPADFSSAGPLPGGGPTVFVMAAIADFINFGGWAGTEIFQGGRFRSLGQAGGVRVELFPFYRLIPSLKDLGIYGNFGVGGASLIDEQGLQPRAYGVRSSIGGGVFYEWRLPRVFGRHLALGPTLEYTAIFAEAITRQTFLLGGRMAFYGVP